MGLRCSRAVGAGAMLACLIAASLPASVAAAAPSPDTWQTSSSLVAGRAYASAITLPDGRVLAAGGRNSVATALPLELRNASTGAWTTQSAYGLIGSALVR